MGNRDCKPARSTAPSALCMPLELARLCAGPGRRGWLWRRDLHEAKLIPHAPSHNAIHPVAPPMTHSTAC
jgi:hypothetical protein